MPAAGTGGTATSRARERTSSSSRRRTGALKPGTLKHFEEFCHRFLVLDNGRAFKLEPFQRLILAGFFAGCSEVLVLLPKKNGKTTLLAALAIYHLIYTPDANCYIAASAVDQARILYEQACGFVERRDEHGRLRPQSAALQKRVMLRKGTKEIRSRRDSGFIRVVSGDKDTVDGVIVTLALVDELHRHKDGQLYGVLADGIGPRDGQVMVISTAGQSMKSALGRIRAKALALPGVKRRGKYTFVRSADGSFEMHEWSLDDEDDRDDFETVKLANPLSTNTVPKLKARRESPTMTESRWARFGCGVWMQGEDAAYSSLDWARAANPEISLEPGTRVLVGLDIGWRWDTTAAVAGHPHDREDLEVDGEEGWWRYRRVQFVKPKIVVPPRNGESLPRREIIAAVLHFRDELGLEIEAVVFDRNAEGESVAQELESDHGLTVIEHSQDPSMMADSSMGFAVALGDGLIEQPADPEFTAHVLACRTRSVSGERWRIEPPTENRGQRKRGKQESDDIEVIDAGVAAVMLHRIATRLREPEREPMIAWR